MVSPSVLSADFGQLDRDIMMLNASHCDWIHLDVMDGVFVPNISFGFPVMQAIARKTEKPLDVHLMIEHPEKFIPEVNALGTYIMSVHQEACPHLHRVVQQIKDAGMKAGVVLNPATSLTTVEEILGEADMILLVGEHQAPRHPHLINRVEVIQVIQAELYMPFGKATHLRLILFRIMPTEAVEHLLRRQRLTE